MKHIKYRILMESLTCTDIFWLIKISKCLRSLEKNCPFPDGVSFSYGSMAIHPKFSGLKKQAFIISHASTGHLNASADMGCICQDPQVALYLVGLSVFIPGRVQIILLQNW